MKNLCYLAVGSWAMISLESQVMAWEPGVGSESDTSGFTVDTQSRNDVISFWHCVYKQSEGYESRINWTGSIGSGNPGTTAANFKDDVERRINFYRAMAGMSADIDITSSSTVVLSGSTPSNAKPSASTTKQTAAQAAALMLSCNSNEFRPGGGVATGAHDPHQPPGSWFCDTTTARNGSYHSNLAVGRYGPGAIDAYMLEDDQAAAGGSNDDVGHRRFIFFSRLQELATGDVTQTPSGSTPFFSANALYVSGNLLPAASSPEFISWPNEGYFPEPLLPERWSVSFPDADFSVATVTMTDAAGGPISTTVVSRTAVFGDSTIAWKPNAAAILSAATTDRIYNVTISNIIVDSTPVSYSFTTTVINPNRLTDSTNLSGSTSPPDTGAHYFFDPVDQAENYRLEVSKEISGTWTEGAEDSTSSYVSDGTASSYALRDGASSRSGSKGFHVGLTGNNTLLQYFQLERLIVPAADSSLSFYHRRRRMGGETRARAEISTDDGVTWTELWGLNGNNNYSNSFTQQTVSLSSYAGQIVMIRFSVSRPIDATSAVWAADGNPGGFGSFNGIHFDDITVTGSDKELSDVEETDYTSSVDSILLNTTTSGESGALLDTSDAYILRLRVKVGCQWFAYGDALSVTPVSSSSLTSYENWYRGNYAVIGDFDEDFDNDGIPNGVEHVFGLNPMSPLDATAALTPTISGGNLQLSHAIVSGETVTAEYSHTLESGSWTPATVSISGGTATATIPLTGTKCFLRWKAIEP